MFTHVSSSTRQACRARRFHASSLQLGLAQQRLPASQPRQRAVPIVKKRVGEESRADRSRETPPLDHTKRNEVGVQLLSRRLHAQIFKKVSFPAPDPRYVRIARDHLEMHGLDRTQGSVLPDISFTLPPLQGRTIDEHFHRLGAHAAEPWLSLAKDLSVAELPPRPEEWDIQSGWTKYHFHADGSSYSEHVEYPHHHGQPEDMLTFDVETMPNYSPYPIMACVATRNGWYAWISPWLLGETEDPHQLIPFGPHDVHRIIIGHNVSYDRARILEEYDISGTRNRFLDTMALHVAVKGISSHQRPAWMKYRKSKLKEREQKEEAYEAVVDLLRDMELQHGQEIDEEKRERLVLLRESMQESLPELLTGDDALTEDDGELASKRWEDITSANSLADVAKLHCNIDADKTIRNDFMSKTPADIRENIQDYLTYCSHDVLITHAVYTKVLSQFLAACPSPVSFSGILTMGSSFLTVNEQWEKYLEDAERTYRELENRVKTRLTDLALEAKELMKSEQWKDDVWLSQLDWTPKIASKSRGTSETALSTPAPAPVPDPPSENEENMASRPPAWYRELLGSKSFGPAILNRTLPLLLKLEFDGKPLQYSTQYGWHFIGSDGAERLPGATAKILSVLGPTHGIPHFKSGRLVSSDQEIALAVSSGDRSAALWDHILLLAERIVALYGKTFANDLWMQQLDWSTPKRSLPKTKTLSPAPKSEPVVWPKWFWDLTRPKKDCPPGSIDVTARSRISPLLLKLSWQNWPMFHSRQYGWTFRVDKNADYTSRQKPLEFYDPADETLQSMALQDGFIFYKIPHKDGDTANVGSPLGKTFINYSQDGTMTSPGDGAKNALDMNAQCSYWISARDRVLKQMVVWQRKAAELGLPLDAPSTDKDPGRKWGVIVPQVITMGTVTRRAIEKTWLTASNAKKNRVGSELKAMVRAPDGYAIVGADVDSEELWISSVMGDAQFGLHGATAIGWMTLEGTKAAGTDLHSKTASILGISRDQAKVFNYSRIYGAGMRHAVLLLLQANPSMLPDQAQKLAENLYASTKGKNTHRTDMFGRKFWFGGTESFVFNKLEEIAQSDHPQTPALGCGVTYALSKEYLPAEFGSDYMPSRINWVVQSSGVDYLHLLIVAMNHLITKYDIKARYLISVHDELRYLVEAQDRYRAALALQIANLWTRSLFAYRLGMDDLPQGVAFFSAVDVDHVLRKETDMPCVTPSQPNAIKPGESIDIQQVLDKTNGGSLWADGRTMSEFEPLTSLPQLEDYVPPNCLAHRASNAAFLQAQATDDFGEVKFWAQQVSGQKFEGGIGGDKRTKQKRRTKKVQEPVDGRNVDWAVVEELLGRDQTA
ncbi:DNA polymerase family A-domain-containing protein [Amylostereum chailletii]|nr:DNA polymerase family A-domain-containing protein [Amylostereum chailletii]